MILNTKDLIKLCSIAENCAKKASEYVMKCLEKEQHIRHKNAGESLASQVVTETDFESQKIILDNLKDSIQKYDLGVLTEESTDNKSRFSKEYFWCVDPLDGTLPFTKKIPGFSISIALVSKSGEPLIGVVYDPTTRNLYSAVKGMMVLKNGEKWIKPEPKNDFTLIYDHSFLKEKQYQKTLHYFKKKYDTVHEINHAGAVMNAVYTVEHCPAIYFKPAKQELGGGSIWDFTSTACLLKELGVHVSDSRNKPLNLNPKNTTFMNDQGICFGSLNESEIKQFLATMDL